MRIFHQRYWDNVHANKAAIVNIFQFDVLGRGQRHKIIPIKKPNPIKTLNEYIMCVCIYILKRLRSR